MTLRDAQQMARDLQMVIRKIDGEYQVKLRAWSWDAAGVYFTDDLDDAIETMKYMAGFYIQIN